MIRLFVGVSAQNEDLEAQLCLEASARRYCSEELEIVWMHQQASGPWSGWRTDSWRTPFTGYRWALPAVCGYQGRAAYVDVDFLIRADLAELWHQPIPGVLLLHSPSGKLKTSCLLFDCAKAKGHVPSLDVLRRMPDANGSMTNYFRGRRELLSAYDGDWNCIDGGKYEDIRDPRIKAIHFSRIEHQCHFPHALSRLKAEGGRHWYTGPTGPHPRADLQALWDEEYQAGLEAGYTLDAYRVPPFAKAVRRDFTYARSKVSA